MPLYHMGGMDQSLATLLSGGKVIVMDGFQAQRLAQIAVSEPLGWLVVMPGTVDRMITALREVGVPPLGIKVCGVMADLIPRHQIAELTTLLDAPFANTFGSTETGSPPCSGNLVPVGVVPEALPKKLSPLCEVKLVDAEDREVPVGIPGEVAVRGPTLFSGYWQADEANAQDFRNGWFHMGDILVRHADGTFEFVDRAKYVIKSGGENIYPAEIEEVLLSESRVAEAAVVRQADPQWGEVPIAFVARRDDSLTAAELYRLCRQRLAGYKQPKGIRFIAFDDFPRSASGKVQRHELQARLERALKRAAKGRAARRARQHESGLGWQLYCTGPAGPSLSARATSYCYPYVHYRKLRSSVQGHAGSFLWCDGTFGEVMWKGSVGGHDGEGSLLACTSTCGLRCGALSGPRGRDNGWEMASGDAGEAPGWAHRRWKRPCEFPSMLPLLSSPFLHIFSPAFSERGITSSRVVWRLWWTPRSRRTQVLAPVPVQRRSIPIDLFPRLRGETIRD